MIWNVFEKESQSNSRFNAWNALVLTVHTVKMPVGYGKHAIKCMGKPLSVMTHLKKIIVEIKATDNCLAHALFLAIGIIEKNLNYESYRKGWKILPVVRDLLEETGVDLASGGGSQN